VQQVAPLSVEQLYRSADLLALSFASTAEIQSIDGLVGQARAMDAVRFGTKIDKPGFNVFVVGPLEARMKGAVEAVLREIAIDGPRPSDWVYVQNFPEPHKPIAVELPAGGAPRFRDGMRELIDDLKVALPAAFRSEEYQTRRGAVDTGFQKKQGEAFAQLQAEASAREITILRTPMGFALAPTKDGQIVRPEEFAAWPEEKRRNVQATIEGLEKQLERVVHQIPQWEKEHRDEIRRLNRETAQFAIGHSIEETRARFADLPKILEHLERVRAALIDNVGMFVAKSEDEDGAERPGLSGAFEPYEVNVLVTREAQDHGVPIIEELHPTLANLIGRIEYVSQQGVLVTNFRLIKAGALHRANGGYLLLDVRNLLSEPFSWAALKRVLLRHEIAIEDIGRFLGLTSTVSLEPDPIPLNVKIILFGDRLLYFLVSTLDPELGEHFKVLADFEDDVDRSRESEAIFARLIVSLGRRAGLKEMDREAVGRLIEHAARIADHAGKLTLLVDQLRDVLAEADFWATEAKRSLIGRADVERALDERIRRSSRVRDRAQEMILHDVALIDSAGSRVAQVNGLSVIELASFRFGRPSRITCRVRPGGGKVVDIEREVELGGPVHSKGVLILSGFLAGRYALDTPMSLFASLVFEQSYGGVEGDSASSAELYAMLSALADVPVRQDLAVTGSVNQHGEVQAIGGVNEKVEGFFDVCRARGLIGTQGVLIPKANVQHLMLRRDVVEACSAGTFAVYPIGTIDDGIALMTGRLAGDREADGCYPAGSINRLVEDRLRSFADARRRFGSEPAAGLREQPP
jgi:predicted ATP-dependent protease